MTDNSRAKKGARRKASSAPRPAVLETHPLPQPIPPSLHVFASTQRTQGQRANDFCFVPEGEVVTFGMECDSDEDPDGRCGCRRSLVGTTTPKATTTFEVVNWKGTLPELKLHLLAALRETGYADLVGEDEAGKWASSDAEELIRIARAWPTGTVCEKRGDTIQVRVMGCVKQGDPAE